MFKVPGPADDLMAKMDPMRGGIMPNDMHDLNMPVPSAGYNLDPVYHHMSIPDPTPPPVQESQAASPPQQQHPEPEPAQEQIQPQPEPQYDSGLNEFFINHAMSQRFAHFDAGTMEAMANINLEAMVDMEP